MTKQEDLVGQAYEHIREMAESFELKPDSQINEIALAKQFGTSRTPLREALNRLVAEGFLTFQARRGFFCRPLSPAQILALYEARIAVETEAVRLAIEKADDDQLSDLVERLRAFESEYESCEDAGRLLELDELFHVEIARLSENLELVRILENLNGRIRFVRLIYLKNRSFDRQSSPQDSDILAHKSILSRIAEKDIEGAVTAMRRHIKRRKEETIEAVAKALAQIYYVDDFG
jgi:DNA-binding GntR family transcriptional regulator